MAKRIGATVELAQVLGFGAVDLATNQGGQLSLAQREHFERAQVNLQESHTLGRRMLMALGFVAIAASFAPLIALVTFSEHSLVLFISSVLSALSGGALLLWGASTRSMPRLLIPDRVESVEGAIRFKESAKDGWQPMPAFSVDSVDFSVSPQVAAAFAEGRRYRLYYVRTEAPSVMGVLRSVMILSAEATTDSAIPGPYA